MAIAQFNRARCSPHKVSLKVPLLLAAAAAATVAGLQGSLDEQTDRLEGCKHSGHAPAFVVDDYLHAEYTFRLPRHDMEKKGAGEIWLSFKDDKPKVRIHGIASLPKFGEGQITLVVDSATETMYALFRLQELHEAQCVKYAFPKGGEGNRLNRLRWRWNQVCNWHMSDGFQNGAALSHLNWTRSLELELLLSQDARAMRAVNLFNRRPEGFPMVAPDSGHPRNNQTLVKSIDFHEIDKLTDLSPEVADGIFGPPSAHCSEVQDVPEQLAQIELQPPHQRSSALRDLLLLLSVDRVHGPFDRLFLMLSALTVPGDVAVMIQDPRPPSPEDLGLIAFDYRSTVFSQGGIGQGSRETSDDEDRVQHRSDGSIWIDMDNRAFHLQGDTTESKVGPLVADVIAHGVKDRGIYVHVNLIAQGEQQCVAYNYTVVTGNHDHDDEARHKLSMFEELVDVSRQGLSFFSVAELNGEDCGIFVAPLSRGRWIHVWVDMERANLDAVLRSEVHKNGRVIRRTDILGWRVGEDIAAAIWAPTGWNCQSNPSKDHIAHLGLREEHKRSFEMQDALYALRYLPRDFAALELLALTGDVAMMVREPDLPAVWKLPACSMEFRVYSVSDRGAGYFYTVGSFAATKGGHKVRITAIETQFTGTFISIAVENGLLAVRLQEPQQEPRCISIELKDALGLSNNSADTLNHLPAVSGAVFEGVEVVGDMQCNRFRFGSPSGPRSETVEFWYSPEEHQVCQIKVLPPTGTKGARVATFDVPAWRLAYWPGFGDEAHAEELAAAPSGWNCIPAHSAKPEDMWLHFLPEQVSNSPGTDSSIHLSDHSLLATQALTRLGEAFGRVGLLSSGVASALSRLVITPSSTARPSAPAPATTHTDRPQPQAPDVPPPAVSVLSKELRTFSFSFAYTHGPSDEDNKQKPNRGTGEVKVDLARRSLFLRSEGNSSSSLPFMESQVIYRGDRGRLYTRTVIPSQDFEQCWSVRMATLPLPDDASMRPNPFLATYQRMRETGRGPDTVVTFQLGPKKKVDMAFRNKTSLVNMWVADYERSETSLVDVRNWSTAPFDAAWFDPSEEWKCQDLQILESAEHMGNWDLLRVFFPLSGKEAGVTYGRRLVEEV